MFLHVAMTLPSLTLASSVRNLLDLNDNGVLGRPDALGWLFFGTVGLFGFAVCLWLTLAAVVGLGRGARRLGHVAWPGSRGRQSSGQARRTSRGMRG
jgi:hypothetical protein